MTDQANLGGAGGNSEREILLTALDKKLAAENKKWRTKLRLAQARIRELESQFRAIRGSCKGGGRGLAENKIPEMTG